MTAGPGKYDHLATYCTEQSGADVAILVIINGNKGSGFSAQLVEGASVNLLPEILRDIADKIEHDIAIPNPRDKRR